MSTTSLRYRVTELLPVALFLGVSVALMAFFVGVVSPRMLNPMDGETWRATYEAPLLDQQQAAVQPVAQPRTPEAGWVGYQP